MSSVIPVFVSVNPFFNNIFLLNMLYDYIIIYDYNIERKKYNSLSLAGFTLKRTFCTLFTPKSFIVVHTYWYSKVLMCTFMSICYKEVFISVLLFTYFKMYFVFVVCTVHGTQ